MPQITFGTIMALLQPAEVFHRRNDSQYWSGWITGDGSKRNLAVKSVSLDETGLDLELEDGDVTIALSAVPSEMSHTDVLVDGAVVPEARLVFALKPTLGDPTRFAFDFRPILLHGNVARFNVRYDP